MSTDPAIPETSRAIEVTKYGPPNELKVITRPTPTITKPTDLILRVHAFSINPAEWKARRGSISFVTKLPMVLGGDYSGEVVAVGEKVTEWKVGDEVFGTLSLPLKNGCYAEYVRIDPAKDAITAKPKNISHEQAAAAGIAILTAYEGLHFIGGLPTEKATDNNQKKVIVIGASGGIGSYSIQIAKHVMGAYTVGVCSTKNLGTVTNLGADFVIDYKKDDLAEVLKDQAGTYDVIFDTIGGDNYYNKLEYLLKPSGKGLYVTAVGPVQNMGAESPGIGTILKFVGTVGTRSIGSLLGVSKPYKLVSGLPILKFADVAPWFADGRVKSLIPPEQVFAFEDTYKGHELSETSRAVGKIVVHVV